MALTAGLAGLAGCATAPEVIVNHLGMRFVRVPAGATAIGSDGPFEAWAAEFPGYEPRRLTELADESPRRRVVLTRPFYLGQHEVTVGQWKRFLDASGHVPESVADATGAYGYDPEHERARSPDTDAFAGRSPRWSWADPGFPQGDDHPVVNVTWHDAQALARWLGAVEGRRYRLPTEAEWEHACRAGRTTRYPGGDAQADLRGHANVFAADSASRWPRWADRALPWADGHPFTAPVGSFSPNDFGLHDMVGNVWEWVEDWYAEDAYARGPERDPPGPADGTVRVRRGGSWHSWALYARCGYRNWSSPQTRYVLIGIRLAFDDPRGPPAP